ncbi:type I restriction modification enzyme, S subunit [Alishewanella longhuensis]|uniref:Type I restriction modification enzyme, S subunit n=1 Tax=Alishewanella longhuensis TaxID=1091037 RepID=A0ABQ3L9D9_9ALTE|nr:restriction endonuclease subunit S [Alishewanella longhuensis]GHG74331.1 type I restriction modification enzyme, S subunit [Alishewanella longhuensis]
MIKLGCDSSLPKGWQWVDANSVMDVRDGTHDSPKSVDTGIPLVTSKNLVGGKIDFSSCNLISEADHLAISKRSAVDDGDILYAMIGTIGNPVIVEKQIDFSIKNVALFKFSKSSKVFNRFIYHFLNSDLAIRQFESNSRGGTQKFVSLGNIRSLQIPLPPLAEQKRIAAILDKADAIRRKRQQAIQLADDFLRAVFLEMFGDPVTNPKGWEVKPLKAITSKIGSGATPKGGSESYQSEGISLIRSLNIHDNEFRFKDLAFINDEQATRLSNVVVEENDVLLNITGASVCRCTVVPANVLPARVNQHVCIIRGKSDVYSSYLMHVLISSPYKLMLLKMSGAGATREALTKQQIENLNIPVPPVNMQQKFEEVRLKVNSILENSDEFGNESLFESLSQKVFSGQL